MYKPHLPFCPGSRLSCCDYVAWSLSVCALGTATRLQSLALLLFSHRHLAHSVTSPSFTLLICELEGGGRGGMTPVISAFGMSARVRAQRAH